MELSAEHDFIEKCKHEIELRSEWKSDGELRNRDFQYLSEVIFEKTKISISISTLKRIWQNPSNRIPHVSTLNALAKFLDYENWNDFKIKKAQSQSFRSKKNKHNKVVFKKPSRFFALSLVLLASVVIGLALIKKDAINGIPISEIDEDALIFTSKKTVTSGLPNTVVFQYDISNIIFDSAFIQQDWDERRRKKISEKNEYHTSIYYYPGRFSARLVLNDQIVKKHPLFITTDGWMAIYAKILFQEIPIYLNNVDLTKNSVLHVSTNDLKLNKIENDKDFFIGFYNYQDFGEVNCDGFIFETIVKNNSKEGGLTCQYALITIEGHTGHLTAAFSDPGCTSNLFVQFGDEYFDGKKNDLSSLGIDLSDWRNIRYSVKTRNLKIWVDDKEVFQLTSKKDIGKLIGIRYIFYGCGSVKMAQLFDKSNKLIFEDNFE